MTDVQAHIRAMAALKRSEEYERAGDLNNAWYEAAYAHGMVTQWRDSLLCKMAENDVAQQKKAE